MSETKFASVLGAARGQGRAIGAFTCYNLEQLEAVIGAAGSRSAPAIVLISPSSFKSKGGERLIKGFRAMVTGAKVDILIQLDHVSDPRTIERAAACGVDAIMADGSKLSYEDNLSFTRSTVMSMRERGIGVEAELGRVEGSEDETSGAMSGAMTKPDEEEKFRRETEVDCLAVAVGNVHGNYSGTPSLDWARLEEIQVRDPLPLSLHGASGLPDTDLERSVSSGIAKLNVNTELRASYFGCLYDELDTTHETLNLKRLGDSLTEAVSEVVEAKLKSFGWIEKGAS